MRLLNNCLVRFPNLLHKLPRTIQLLMGLAFVAISIKVHPYDGSDFRWYWSLGRAIVEGINPFVMRELNSLTHYHPVPIDFACMPYPASTGVLLLPFALVKFSISAYLFKVLGTGVLVYGTVCVVKKTTANKLTASTCIPIVLFLLLWGPVRWASSNLQLITLISGLFAIFVSVKPDKTDTWRILIFVVVLGLKFTNVIPFLLVFALQRKWHSAIIGLIAGTVVVLGSFMRTGLPGSLLDYLANLRTFSRFDGPADAVTPHVRDAGIRLDFSYFINGFFVDVPNVSFIAIGLAVLIMAAILRFGTGDFTCERGKLSLIACTGVGLLPTYQHVYSWVIFVPIFAMLMTAVNWTRLPSNIRYLVSLILLYGFTTATNVSTAFLRKYVGEFAVVMFRTYPSALLVVITLTALFYMIRTDWTKKEALLTL
jgi:hypothetical protein